MLKYRGSIMNPNTSGERTRISQRNYLPANRTSKQGIFQPGESIFKGKKTEKTMETTWNFDQLTRVMFLAFSSVRLRIQLPSRPPWWNACYTRYEAPVGATVPGFDGALGGFSTDSRKLRESGASKSSTGVCSPDYGGKLRESDFFSSSPLAFAKFRGSVF